MSFNFCLNQAVFVLYFALFPAVFMRINAFSCKKVLHNVFTIRLEFVKIHLTRYKDCVNPYLDFYF